MLAEGTVRTMATGTSLSQMRVLGLRAVPASPRGPLSGEIISQPWYFQGRYFSVDRSSVRVDLPRPDTADPVWDPWFEFGPLQVRSISVMIGGGMQRLPGELIAKAADWIPYYRERCDGVVPGVDATENSLQPTFLIKPKPLTRS